MPRVMILGAVIFGLVACSSSSSSGTSGSNGGATSGTGGGSTSATTGTTSSTTTGGAVATITFMQDGVAKDYSLNAGGGHGIGQINVNGSLQSGSDVSNFDLHVDDPPVVGTMYDCTDPHVLIGLDLLPTTPGGQQPIYTADANTSRQDGTPSSCTITITRFSGDGQPIEGTFSASVMRGPSSNDTIALTNGHFLVQFGF